MNFFVILLSVLSLGLASASPDAYASNYGYYSAPQPLPSAQFHAQDDIGQYNYGYQGDTSAKEEFKTADGVVRGSYSYVDANGIIQTTNYIADALGFRVAATNLPVHVVDEPHAAVAVEAAVAAAPVAAAPVAVAAAVQAAPVVQAAPAGPAVVSTYGYSGHGAPYGVYGAGNGGVYGYGANHGVYGYGGIVRPNPTVDYAYLPYATGYNYHQVPTQYINTYGQSIQEAPIVQVAAAAAPYVAAAPAPYAAPVAAPAPVVYTTVEAAHGVVPVVQGPAHTDSSQYHAQDEFGQYSFGYNDPNSVRQEVKTADGVVRGAYRYVDADGVIQTVEYIADAGGFRVAATNLPVHNVGAVQDTPAVAAAKVSIAEVQAAAAPVVVDSFVVSPSAPVAAVKAAAAEVLPAPTVILQPAPFVIPAPAPIAEAYVHQEIAAEPYVHEEIAAEPYIDVQIADEPYVHTEVAAEPYVHAEVAAEAYVHAEVAAEPYIAAQEAAGDYVIPAEGYVHQEIAAEPYVHVEGAASPIALSYDPFAAPITNFAAPLPISAPVGYQVPIAAPVVYQTPVAAPVVYQTPVAAPVVYQTPVAAPVVHQTPVVHAAPIPVAAATGSQYHAQDDIGQYSFGYSDQNSVKQEQRTADGTVRGSYSYVDSNGLIQTVNYLADALGFRVGATNLPVHHVDAPETAVSAAAPVEVVAAAAAPVAAPVVAPASYYAPALAPQVSYSYLPYASNYGYASQHYAHTVPYATPAVAIAPEASAIPAPIVSATPADAVNSQFHAQDDIGQYNYGFSSPTQTKEELKTADGVTRGSYSYIDANGLIQTVNYISDAMGFRVAATNLPVHQVEGTAPAAVVEEAPAKAAGYSIISPSVNYAYLPYATNYGYQHTVPHAA